MTHRVRFWAEANRDFFWDALRTFLGVALFLKGAMYLKEEAALLEVMHAAEVPFTSHALAEYVALTHLGGGILLTFGMLTRFAAALQVPNLAGAVLLVHLHDGLFTYAQTLELASLVLLLLLAYAVAGSGRWSVDWYFTVHESPVGPPASPPRAPAS